MKKLLGIMAGMLVVAVAAGGAWAGLGSTMMKDPLCQKYIKYHDRYGNIPQYKNATFLDVQRKCKSSILGCKYGWKAAQGKPLAGGLGKFFVDSLAHAKWRNGNRTWIVKFYGADRNAGDRAMFGLVLYPHASGVQAILKIMNTNQKLSDMSYLKRYGYPALWYLGAKNGVDIMIRGLKNKYNNVDHRKWFLATAYYWKLSAAQKKKIVAFCSEIFQSTEGKDKDTVASCLRYLGRIKTRDSDAREYMVNYVGAGRGQVKMEAVRALGFMKHKGAKEKLKENLNKAFRLQKRSVRRRRRYKKVTTKTWYITYNAVESAVALMGMRDKTAKAAIKYWLTINKSNKRFSMASSSGWERTVFEATFAEPKTQKKLKKMIKKALKKLIKADKKERGSYKDYIRRTWIALIQMGDKKALKPILKYLKSSNKDDIKEVLDCLGAYTNRIWGFRAGHIGVNVGKGGLKAKDAQKIVKAIQKRMKFWTDRGMKEKGVRVILEVQARIKASKL